MGTDEKIARRASRLVDTSEYKRRQAPPGVKITTRAFGRDRRLPITNQFKGD
jgi:NAD+ synthase (glutamine-hydrolysing)